MKQNPLQTIDVIDVRGSDKGGWYFTLNVDGGNGQPVTVKLTKHNTLYCHTCNKSDDCPHARHVEKDLEINGRPKEAR